MQKTQHVTHSAITAVYGKIYFGIKYNQRQTKFESRSEVESQKYCKVELLKKNLKASLIWFLSDKNRISHDFDTNPTI